jgi:3-hydroxyisobutyrate dehydrogenase-like beta-hydroxyacid dehydrogenase
MRVAILGMGRMGRAMGARLVETDHEVTIWNRSAGKAAALVAAGAREASIIADAVTGAQVVVTVLTDDNAVREVALGSGGVRSCIGDALYVDCSTVSPELGNELSADFERFVAMPILGSPDAVRAGQATYLVGGSAELAASLDPLLASLAVQVRRYDQPRLAACAKLSTNLLLLCEVAALAEVFTVGRAGGLSDEALRDLLGRSALMPPGLANRFEAVLTGNGPAWWSTALGAKDAGLAVDVASGRGINLGVACAVRDAYLAAAEQVVPGSSEDDDIALVARIYRQ